MTWFRIDDGWHSHPKVVAAGNAAAGLWARCGSHAAHYNLEGRVPKATAIVYGSKREIEKLVACGLWIEHDTYYLMPDWLDYNPSAEQVRLTRKAAAERQRRARDKATESRRDSHVSNAASNGVNNGPVTVPPTRPDPSIQVRDISTPVDTPSAEGNSVDNRLLEVARNYARIALDKAPHVNNPAAYATAAQRTALDHPDIGRYCERWPTAPADAIAAWLHGDNHSMSYYHDTADDEIAPVHPIRGEAG